MNIKQFFLESQKLNELFISENHDNLIKVIEIMLLAIKKWKKIYIAWNGGSAADSMHFAAELIGRYKLNRNAIGAISLNSDVSVITAIGNDYGFEYIFSRQIEWLWEEGDIFIWFSTSGMSKNILNAMIKSQSKWMINIGILGNDGGSILAYCDYSLVVRSNNTPRIQEIHTIIYHSICEEIEYQLFA